MVNKYTVIIIAVAMILSFIAASVAMQYMNTKPAIELQITVKDDVVTNVTMEQVNLPFFYKQTSGKVNFPDISVNAKPDMLEAKPITYWASSPYTGDGIYTMTLTFEESSPKIDDFLILPIRITDTRGHIIYKQTGFYTWK
jgi:hypothetical protein